MFGLAADVYVIVAGFIVLRGRRVDEDAAAATVRVCTRTRSSGSAGMSCRLLILARARGRHRRHDGRPAQSRRHRELHVDVVGKLWWWAVHYPRLILTVCTLLTGLIGLGYLLYDHVVISLFFFFAMISALLSVFHSAIVPISDSIVLSDIRRRGGDYGLIRLWGAIGYAFAVWIAGLLIELTFTAIIFYIFASTLFVSVFFAKQMPGVADVPKVDLRAGLKQLFRIPPYVVFLCSTFLIFGAINANNFYFGMYYTSIGGTVAGVGLVFLIAAGSEAPFMLFVKKVITRFGLYPILMLAGVISSLRWILFFFDRVQPGF